MLAPRPAGAFVNENEVGAPTQGAKKGLQAKRGLNGPPLSHPVMHALTTAAVHSSHCRVLHCVWHRCRTTMCEGAARTSPRAHTVQRCTLLTASVHSSHCECRALFVCCRYSQERLYGGGVSAVNATVVMERCTVSHNILYTPSGDLMTHKFGGIHAGSPTPE